MECSLGEKSILYYRIYSHHDVQLYNKKCTANQKICDLNPQNLINALPQYSTEQISAGFAAVHFPISFTSSKIQYIVKFQRGMRTCGKCLGVTILSS